MTDTGTGPLELAVIVPVFKERDNIKPLLQRLATVLASVNHEIIFVDDDSPDSTSRTIREIALTNPHIRVLTRIRRRGLSSACLEGMMATAAPYIAVMDADLQHDEQILPEMLATLRTGNVDLVVGTRNAGTGSMGEFSASRVRLSNLGRRLSRLVCRCELSDPMSGFFMLTRPHQWKLFATPIILMAFLAIPWNPAIFQRLPPFLPGAQGGSENFMWQPAKLSRLSEFIWSSIPYQLREASLSLAAHVGPFLLVGVVFLFLLRPVPVGTIRLNFDSPRRRAHLYVVLWFLAILAGATALPELNYFFRIRYGILPLIPVSILLASAFGWFLESRASLPRWLVVFALVLFGIQLTVNADRSLRYRRSFGIVEAGVDQTYQWISKYFPNDDLVLMPDFLPYDYHLDAPPAIRNKRRISGLDELFRTGIPNRTTLVSWQAPTSPSLKFVGRFNGCSPQSLFDLITGCPPGLQIYVSRYLGPPAGMLTPSTAAVPGQNLALAQTHLNKSFQACREKRSQECIAEAREAIRLLPDFPEAYNNIAAANESLGRWDDAIEAATQALRLRPDFQLAKNNLAWSLSQKKINAPPPPQE